MIDLSQLAEATVPMQLCSTSSFAHARTRAASPHPREHERTQARARARRVERTQDHRHTCSTTEARANPSPLVQPAIQHIRVHGRTRAAITRPCEHARTQETARTSRAERTRGRSHICLPAAARANPSQLSWPAIHARSHARPNPSNDPDAAHETNPRCRPRNVTQGSRRARPNPSGPCPMPPHARRCMLDGLHPDGPPPLTARCTPHPGRSSRR